MTGFGKSLASLCSRRNRWPSHRLEGNWPVFQGLKRARCRHPTRSYWLTASKHTMSGVWYIHLKCRESLLCRNDRFWIAARGRGCRAATVRYEPEGVIARYRPCQKSEREVQTNAIAILLISTVSRPRAPRLQCGCVGPDLCPQPAPRTRHTRRPRTAGALHLIPVDLAWHGRTNPLGEDQSVVRLIDTSDPSHWKPKVSGNITLGISLRRPRAR